MNNKELIFTLKCLSEQTINDKIKLDLLDIEKELKALDVIRESIPIEEEDFFYDKETDTYFFIGNKVSKEQFYLLKEVLLCQQ